jgi:hypothetical protein
MTEPECAEVSEFTVPANGGSLNRRRFGRSNSLTEDGLAKKSLGAVPVFV